MPIGRLSSTSDGVIEVLIKRTSAAGSASDPSFIRISGSAVSASASAIAAEASPQARAALIQRIERSWRWLRVVIGADVGAFIRGLLKIAGEAGYDCDPLASHA